MGVSDIDPHLSEVLAGPRLWTGGWKARSPAPAGPLLAFAGIAKPWRFFQALEAAGAQVAGTEAFPDHAPFTETALARLGQRAAALGAGLVTTEKDWVRLPSAWRETIAAWPVTIRIDDEAAARAWLLERLDEAGAGRS